MEYLKLYTLNRVKHFNSLAWCRRNNGFQKVFHKASGVIISKWKRFLCPAGEVGWELLIKLHTAVQQLIHTAYHKKVILYVADDKLHGFFFMTNPFLNITQWRQSETFHVGHINYDVLSALINHNTSFLAQVHGESKENPFRRRSTARLLDPVVVNLVQQIPGVGKVKAMVLLQHFSSIQKICNVSVEELEPVVGQATAQHIWAFFHDILPWWSDSGHCTETFTQDVPALCNVKIRT